MDGWVDGWVGGWVDGWKDGWMGGWMDGWMDGYSWTYLWQLELVYRSLLMCLSCEKLKFSAVTSTPGFAKYIQALQMISIISEPHADELVA